MSSWEQLNKHLKENGTLDKGLIKVLDCLSGRLSLEEYMKKSTQKRASDIRKITFYNKDIDFDETFSTKIDKAIALINLKNDSAKMQSNLESISETMNDLHQNAMDSIHSLLGKSEKPTKNSGINQTPGLTRSIGGSPFVLELKNNKANISRLEIKNIREMRKKITSKEQLRDLGIDEKAANVFYSFTQLARLFPSDIVIVLQQSGIDDIRTLLKLNEKQFRTSLRKAGLKSKVLEFEVSRFNRIQKMVASGSSADSLSGLEVDLGAKTKLSKEDKQLLAEAGIETLEDWSVHGASLQISNDTKKLLDARVRLTQLSFDIETTDILIGNRIFSSLDILNLNKQARSSLARNFSTSTTSIEDLGNRARELVEEAMEWVNDGLIDGVRPIPEDDKTEQCGPCLESQSAFSCFAYFLYLVNKTQQTVQALDNILHQDIATLAPFTSEEELPQVRICLGVLTRLLPRGLPEEDKMRADRLQIGLVLSLLPIPLSEFAEKILEILAKGGTVELTKRLDFIRRLRLLLTADKYGANPNFSKQEREVMLDVLDLYLIGMSMDFLPMTIEQFSAIVLDNDPAIDLQSLISRLESTQQFIYRGTDKVSFSGAEIKIIWQTIELHISARGSQQIIDPKNNAELEAIVLKRDLLKIRLRKTDSQLYQQLFIETNLGRCEKISRLKQVISSLQALLLAFKNNAVSLEARSSFDFLSYQQWRSEEVARYYPELGALYRGDALVGDSGAIDRGSFLKNHLAQKALIEDQLEQAMENIKLAKFSGTNDFSPPDNMDDAEFGGLKDFDTTPFIEPFENGIDFIEQFLTIDQLVIEAHEQIDKEEPGVAIAVLEQAMSDIDGLYYLASDEGSILRDSSREIYQRLLLKSPRERQLSVEDHWFALETGDKTIFEPLLPPTEIAGLTNNRFSDRDVFNNPTSLWRWPGSAIYNLRGTVPDIILEKSSPHDGGDQFEPGWVYYADNDLATNYSFKITFNLTARSNEPFAVGDYIGLGIRLREEGVVDQLTGYQVVIRSHYVRTVPEEVSTGNNIVDGVLAGVSLGGRLIGIDEDIDFPERLRYFLVVQEIKADGNAYDVTDEKEVAASLSPETLCTLDVQVNETDLEVSYSSDDEPLINNGITTIQYNEMSNGSGSFGVVATHGVQADFLTFDVGLRNPNQALPFQAVRRRDNFVIRTTNLHYHRWFGDSSALSLPQPLNSETSDYTFAERGISTDATEADSDGRWLVFAPENKVVDIERLDKLLEHCMEGMFYLRYLTIPLALSRAYLEAGDFARSAEMMRLIYDINDNTAIATEIYPFFSENISDSKMPGLDVRLMRLRIAEIYLRWATWLFQQNSKNDRKKARDLLNQIIVIHGGHQYCDCNRKVDEVIARIYAQERVLTTYPANISAGIDFSALLVLLSDPVMDDSLLDEDIIDEMDFTGDRNIIQGKIAKVESKLAAKLTQQKNTLATHNNVKSLVTKAKEKIQQSEVQLFSRQATHVFDSLFQSNDVVRNRTIAPLFSNKFSLRTENVINYISNVGYPYRGGSYFLIDNWISFTLCLPENPLMQIQRQQACMMLDDLLHCRNILGFEEGLVPPLRYEALDRIATGFSSLALSAERDLLQFRRETEATHISETEAVQNLAVSIANIAIEANRVAEAEGGILLAALQKRQTIETVNHLDELIESGLSDAEKFAMRALAAAVGFTVVAGVANAASSFAGMFTSSAAAVSGGIGIVGSGASSAASVSQMLSQLASMQASFERREQEWRHQLSINRIGLQISEQSLQQAQIRRTITQQQLQLAQLRSQFAQDGLTFLANKFLNSAMFLWMMQTVRREYKQRLNYANGAAFMAQQALSFELQQELDYIRFDYFDPRRDGLLGATQLDTDLATLRNIKLSATERKLQIRKTISLRSQLPIEFQQFKSGTGALNFVTLMDWFDRDRPGEYLRTIKSVRVTVLALIPPNAGIHASLNSNGISTIVGRPPEFRAKTVRRDPESIALSAAFNDTGVFVLDYRGDLLLPFEGGGVETSWAFSMPKATNQFNFETIADILLTIEYTAFKDTGYQQIIIEQLKEQGFKADQIYTIRNQFPDEWYHLHNPVDPNTAPSIKVTVAENHFPSNLSAYVVKHLSLYLDWENGDVKQELNIILKFIPVGGNVISSPAVWTDKGIIRTRNKDAIRWTQHFIDDEISPFGEWIIEFENTPEIRVLFSENKINDILFGFSFEAEPGGWD